MKPPFLPCNEPNLCINYILRDSEYIDRFFINFLCHCVSNQVDSNTNLLNNVLLTKGVLQPTEKNKKCRPTQIKIGENRKQNKITPPNKKSRSVSTQLCDGSSE